MKNVYQFNLPLFRNHPTEGSSEQAHLNFGDEVMHVAGGFTIIDGVNSAEYNANGEGPNVIPFLVTCSAEDATYLRDLAVRLFGRFGRPILTFQAGTDVQWLGHDEAAEKPLATHGERVEARQAENHAWDTVA